MEIIMHGRADLPCCYAVAILPHAGRGSRPEVERFVCTSLGEGRRANAIMFAIFDERGFSVR